MAQTKRRVYQIDLWLIGLPVSYGHVDLAFDAVIRLPDGQEIGRKSFYAQMGLTEWMYSGYKFPRELMKTYESISPEFRDFVYSTLKSINP